MCCSVLRCVAMCSSVLRRVAVCCSEIQCVAVRNSGSPLTSRSNVALDAPCCVEIVCCSVLQCVAVCVGVLQCVAVCGSVWQCVAVRNLQTPLTSRNNVALDAPRGVDLVCCSVLQCLAMCFSALQHVALYCSVMQCIYAYIFGRGEKVYMYTYS